MTAVVVYGASDDLIEVEGDLREEFNRDSDDQETWLIFGDGTILAIRYDEFGIWWVIAAEKMTFHPIKAKVDG